jgi:carboxypeptidase family protein
MSRVSSRLISFASCLLAVVLIALPCAWAQHGTEGNVSVTVLDPSGSVVDGAQLELRDLSTNAARTAQSSSAGTYTFVNLPLGNYKLTASKPGFKSQVFDQVVVQATKTTDINATLAVGALSETVEVTATAAPLIETTSNAIGNVIDLKQIEDLPIQGRDLTQLTQLVPGYTGTLADGGGTWNGLPSIAQGNSIDGVQGSAGRMKFGGAAEPAVEPRVENIQEMTVQTDQLDLNQGYGTSSMQINFVTRRGSNAFHGRAYEDFRNDWLDANSWSNDFVNASQPRLPGNRLPLPNKLILNEFGGSVGGPIIKNKLFFFGGLSLHRQPSQATPFAKVIGSSAQSGMFTYIGNDLAPHTVDLFNLAASCTICGATPLPTQVNQVVQSQLSDINSALKLGALTQDPDPSYVDLNWHVPTPDNEYFPTVRLDYNATDRMRFNVAWNYTHIDQPASIVQALPGSTFSSSGAGNRFKNYTAAFGFDWTLSPTVVNEFRGGFLYNGNFFGYNAKTPPPGTFVVSWQTFVPTNGNNGNGTSFVTPVGSYYPLFNASDTMTWQRHSHTLNFGFSWWREQNHYYNGVLGFPTLNLGLSAQDPAANAFTTSTLPNSTNTNAVSEAQNIYAALVGRVSGAFGNYSYTKKTNSYCEGCIGAYNLDELQKSFGFFAQDSYRIKPTLTLNYGLRWDFTWPDYDLTGAYHSAAPDAIWGPSGVNNLFHPGSLNGTMNPQITQNSAPAKPWYIAPQPAIGFAWNPRGLNNTVIRGGFSLRKFTEPQQYFWNQASDYGSFYFQNFQLVSQAVGGGTQPPGTYAPGTLALGNSSGNLVLNGQSIGVGSISCVSPPPAVYACTPATYHVNEPESDFTFLGGPGVNGVDPNIKQPYTESWNFGIQRQIGQSRALELRYIGNRSLRQWMTINQNEVNIFENGFLKEFRTAQANLALNGGTTFADSTNGGVAATAPLPIMDAAFSGDSNLGDTFQNGGFINLLNTGQAGAFASSLANTPLWFCDLVGSTAFAPCANNAGINVAGAGYPINFFQVNPYAIGTGFVFSQLVSEGYSNYNGLQVDLRQRAWHGLQFDANYTWSHTLGITTQNNWQGAVTSFTLRNMRLSYGPALFDVRHSIHISGTYDLPIGRGRALSTGNALDRVIGGWTLGTIFTFQTGNPFPIAGGNGGNQATFNDYGDGGVVLNGVTVSQLQSSVGVYHIQGQPNVDFINPKYLANGGTGGGANPSFLSPNTTPGTIMRPIWLYGPHFINDDISMTKRFAITERVNLSLQAMALNAFNHPTFQVGSGAGCSYYCYARGNWQFPWIQLSGFGIGSLSPSYQPRVVELRGNIEF